MIRPLYSIRIFDLGNEDQARCRFERKSSSTWMGFQKLALLDRAVCSQSIDVHFAAYVRTYGSLPPANIDKIRVEMHDNDRGIALAVTRVHIHASTTRVVRSRLLLRAVNGANGRRLFRHIA